MISRIFLCTCLLSWLVACSSPKLIPHADADLEQLGICIAYDPMVPEEVQMLFDRKLDDFILRYNSEPHPFYLHHCSDPEVKSVRLHIAGTKLVSSGEQVAGVIVSAIGFSLPFIMVAAGANFYVWFYYFPRDISEVGVSLSDDISHIERFWIKRTFANSGFLMRTEKQLHKHSQKFDWFLTRIFLELEKSHRKNTKKKALQG